MSCLRKIIELVAVVMIFAGFMLLLGTAGASDYADEIGGYFSYRGNIPQVIAGLVMMFVGGKIIRWYEDE